MLLLLIPVCTHQHTEKEFHFTAVNFSRLEFETNALTSPTRSLVLCSSTSTMNR